MKGWDLGKLYLGGDEWARQSVSLILVSRRGQVSQVVVLWWLTEPEDWVSDIDSDLSVSISAYHNTYSRREPKQLLWEKGKKMFYWMIKIMNYHNYEPKTTMPFKIVYYCKINKNTIILSISYLCKLVFLIILFSFCLPQHSGVR